MSVKLDINGEKVEISDDLIAEFEALEDVRRWMPEEDALLWTYWPRKPHRDVAKLLNRPRSTCENRFSKLMEDLDEDS